MSEPTPTATKEDETKKISTPTNGQKFAGEGVPFKGKLIGMEDLTIDRDEKVCLESMFKLKAVVRARGEHKQKIQINLTTSTVKITDDTTKAQIASHEIERISFVVMDPRDTRAFGYVYNTSDDRHQFWAIKTERAAAATVLSLKELFEFAFEEFTKNEKAKEGSGKAPASPPEIVIPPAQVTTPAPISPPSQPVSEPAPKPKEPSLLDDVDWTPSPSTTVAQPTQQAADSLFGFDEPVLPPAKQAPAVVEPLANLFGGLSTNPQPAPAAPKNNNDLLFDVFSNSTPTPVPPPTNQFGNFNAQPVQPNLFSAQPIQPNLYNPNPTVYQQQSLSPVTPPTQAPDLLRPTSPVAPPTVTSPFADLDFFGNLSTTKPTKESFFPTAQPTKTVQQLLLEKQP